MIKATATTGKRRMARGPMLADDQGPSLDASAGHNLDQLPTSTPTKTACVLALLTRPEGASLDDLVAATGWLPHTTRAALTGLRKKGHAIGRVKVDGLSRYLIRQEPAA